MPPSTPGFYPPEFTERIHLDLYVPHQPRLGRHLELRTERLVRRTEVLDAWVVLEPPAHLATKLAALVDRPASAPGDKDRHEIMALVGHGVATAEAVGAVHDASAREPAEVTRLIDRAFEYLGDLRLDRNEWRTTQHRRPSRADRAAACPDLDL